MKKSLLPADTFIVINKTLLNDADRNLLIMLYQPIIGSVAVSLYFTLWSYLDKKELSSLTWTHHHLMTSMRMRLDELLEAREKLEAIGLIRTYLKESNVNCYAYVLYSPLSANEFFKNPILSTSLYNNVGDTEYNKIIDYFKMPLMNFKDYEEVTCHFDEVFDSVATSSMEHLISDIRKPNTNSLELISKIDLDGVLELIPDDLLNHRSLTKETKDLIYKIAFVYHLNEDEMGEIIRNSINEKKMIDKEKLRFNSRRFYQFEHSGKLPSLVYRKQPEYLRKPIGDTSLRAKLIYQFETTSPYEFLCGKNKTNTLSKTESEILGFLALDLNLRPGVINVLLDYVLKINNNKLTKSFIETIALQWQRSNVETVEGAMELAEKEYKKRKQKLETKTSKRIIEKPEWFDKKIEKQNLNQEEEQELAELLKSFK